MLKVSLKFGDFLNSTMGTIIRIGIVIVKIGKKEYPVIVIS